MLLHYDPLALARMNCLHGCFPTVLEKSTDMRCKSTGSSNEDYLDTLSNNKLVYEGTRDKPANVQCNNNAFQAGNIA